MAASTRWEHRVHEFPKGIEPKTTEGDYLLGDCPACERVNTLLCMMDGVVHMKQAQVCSGCRAPLPFGAAVEKAIKSGPPADAPEKVTHEKEPSKPEPEAPIDPAALVAAQEKDSGQA